MSDIAASQKNHTDEHKEKYFSFQIRGWTNFDPTNTPLSRIEEGIDQGDGVLSLVEVLKIENDLASIADDDVRECFANTLAAKRLVRTIHELPKNLRERVLLALREDGAPKKAVASVTSLPVNDESTSLGRQWP